MTDAIVEAVAAAVGEDRCMVAMGGGADSAVLLWAAVGALGPDRVRGAFVHHGLSGSDDLRDAALAVATALGVECDVVSRPVEEGGNLEARAREARYEALEALADGDEVGVTGHTSDDQAETVIMRLTRGAGAGALGGIPYERGVWRRPLLGFSRTLLRTRAEQLGLPFADDPANDDRRFLRSRVRHTVLPMIEQECGPAAKSMILRSAELLSADDSILEDAAAAIPILPIDAGVAIPVAPLLSSSEPIASRCVRRALRTVFVEQSGAGTDIDAVLSVARGGPPTSISRGWQVTPEPPFVVIHRPTEDTVQPGFRITPGESFDWHGSRYSVMVEEVVRPYVAGGRFTVMDVGVLDEGMEVRGVLPGDRIDIEVGSSPVKELLRAAGIPARVRPRSLVVTVGGNIAALDGVRVASWARPRPGEAVVRIEREVGKREVDTWK